MLSLLLQYLLPAQSYTPLLRFGIITNECCLLLTIAVFFNGIFPISAVLLCAYLTYYLSLTAPWPRRRGIVPMTPLMVPHR